MPTIRKDQSHPYVKELDARIVAITSAEGEATIILDQTIFFPESGGQPSDQGTIQGLHVGKRIFRRSTTFDG